MILKYRITQLAKSNHTNTDNSNKLFGINIIKPSFVCSNHVINLIKNDQKDICHSNFNMLLR